MNRVYIPRRRPDITSRPAASTDRQRSAISSARTSSFVWIFFCRYAIRSCSAEWLDGLSARRPPLRSRRTPSASDRTPWAASPVHRRASRSAPSPVDAASGWPPSLPASSASAASSCVLSLTLLEERLLHFQLNRSSDP